MTGFGQDVLTAPLLGHVSRVEHDDSVGDLGDNCEIVRDVQRANFALSALAPDEFDDSSLRDNVQSRGGLVQYHHLRIEQEGHGDADALLLAPRQLVWVAAQEVGRPRQPNVDHRCPYSGFNFRPRFARLVHLDEFANLDAYAQRGIQGCRGILWNVRDGFATD